MITVREYCLPLQKQQHVRYCSGTRSQQQSIHQNTNRQDRNNQRLSVQNTRNVQGLKQRAYSISKDNKENENQMTKIEDKSISTIPLVYKSLDGESFFKQFLAEIQPLVQIHKQLLYNQWILYTNYKKSIQQLINEVWKDQKEEQSHMLLAIQTFNIMKRLLRYLDLDEEYVSKLIHINTNNLTQNKAEQLMQQIFISPNFFITNEKQESTNLMEMIQLMKQVVDLTVKSEDLFRQLFMKYNRDEASGIFKQLTNGISQLQQHLNIQKLKADYCLHFLYKFGNCMQADMKQFQNQFKNKQ